jgi:predicted nucleotidyltransferase
MADGYPAAMFDELFTAESLITNEVGRLFPPHCILITYRGSKAHGTYDDGHIDDIDYLATYIEKPEHYFGFAKSKSELGHHNMEGMHDAVSHEIRKLFDMLLGCNPNVMSLLHCNEDHVIYSNTAGQELRTCRDLFSSERAYWSFKGVANSHLEQLQESAEQDDPVYRGYMGANRKQLVKEHGYDCKNAAHVIRYLRMGAEFLRTGELPIDRRQVGDADELLEIKKGHFSLDTIMKTIDNEMRILDKAMDKTVLPPRPSFKEIQGLLMHTLQMELCYK